MDMGKLGLRVMALALIALLGSLFGAIIGNVTLMFSGVFVAILIAAIVMIVACFRMS